VSWIRKKPRASLWSEKLPIQPRVYPVTLENGGERLTDEWPMSVARICVASAHARRCIGGLRIFALIAGECLLVDLMLKIALPTLGKGRELCRTAHRF
jgi:hypothetical protein